MANPNQGPGAPAKTPGASGPAESRRGDDKRSPLQARWTTLPPGEPDRSRAAESQDTEPPSPPESGTSDPPPAPPQEPRQSSPPLGEAIDAAVPMTPALVTELNRLAVSLQEVARALADLDTALHRGPTTPDANTSNPALLSQLFQGRHDMQDVLRRYLFGKPG